MNKLGPRVIFKDDRDSSSGRGCRLYSNHFTSFNMLMLVSAVQAFTERPNIGVIRFTEGWRDIRNDRLDLHEECRAFDVTAEDTSKNRFTYTQYEIVAQKIRFLVGPGYDIVVHGEGSNLHIHMEFDPKFEKKKE